MAGPLWISRDGKRRKGTTFTGLQQLFVNQITTKHIFESLYSAHENDDAAEVLSDLNSNDFDVAGVIDDEEKVVAYIVERAYHGEGYQTSWNL